MLSLDGWLALNWRMKCIEMCMINVALPLTTKELLNVDVNKNLFMPQLNIRSSGCTLMGPSIETNNKSMMIRELSARVDVVTNRRQIIELKSRLHLSKICYQDKLRENNNCCELT